jgi:hypothetical protein
MEILTGVAVVFLTCFEKVVGLDPARIRALLTEIFHFFLQCQQVNV